MTRLGPCRFFFVIYKDWAINLLQFESIVATRLFIADFLFKYELFFAVAETFRLNVGIGVVIYVINRSIRLSDVLYFFPRKLSHKYCLMAFLWVLGSYPSKPSSLKTPFFPRLFLLRTHFLDWGFQRRFMDIGIAIDFTSQFFLYASCISLSHSFIRFLIRCSGVFKLFKKLFTSLL